MSSELNFQRIAKAIEYLRRSFKSQPSLDEAARCAGLSPYYFQRMFQEWAGVSPKKFVQYLDVSYAKKILEHNQSTLFDAAYQTGLSGTGRLHDLFVKIEGMTPGEYKNGGENLHINYSTFDSKFGRVFAASTAKGICYMGFDDEKVDVFSELFSRFPKAVYHNRVDDKQQRAVKIFQADFRCADEIKLHLKATDFQLKVWETLLKIPAGELTTYGRIANQIKRPGACRAVGTAVGDNPVSLIIPCHRVIQSSGIIGQYHWGSERKVALIGYEAARTMQEESRR